MKTKLKHLANVYGEFIKENGTKRYKFGSRFVNKWTYPDGKAEYEIADGVTLSYQDLKALHGLIEKEIKEVEGGKEKQAPELPGLEVKKY